MPTITTPYSTSTMDRAALRAARVQAAPITTTLPRTTSLACALPRALPPTRQAVGWARPKMESSQVPLRMAVSCKVAVSTRKPTTTVRHAPPSRLRVHARIPIRAALTRPPSITTPSTTCSCRAPASIRPSSVAPMQQLIITTQLQLRWTTAVSTQSLAAPTLRQVTTTRWPLHFRSQLPCAPTSSRAAAMPPRLTTIRLPTKETSARCASTQLSWVAQTRHQKRTTHLQPRTTAPASMWSSVA